MPKYSRSHERSERAKIARGMWESLFGLIFCWLPGVGLLLSVAGFCRQVVRLTEAYRVRRFFALVFASVVLVASIGALMGEAYLYSRNPAIVSDTGRWLWQKVTGQQALPGEMPSMMPEEEGDGADEPVPDEYYTDEGVEEGDVPANGQEEEGDVPPDIQAEEGDVPAQMEEGDLPMAEGDFKDDIDFVEDDSDEPGAEDAEATLPPLRDLLKSSGVAVG
jgi:hypothetical protein